MSDSIRLTLKTVQTDLRAKAPDMTIRKTDCGEYRITFTQSAILAVYPHMSRNEAIAKAESLAAYASDICEAYETAKSMARVGLAPEQATESDVARAIVKRAIDSGYVVSVNDGEETTIHLSRDIDAICAALETTGEDLLTLYSSTSLFKRPIGRIYLIWGNGPNDLVHDCTDNAATLAICEVE